MQSDADSPSLLQLPDTALISILQNLDASSLIAISQTSRYFSRKVPVTLLPLTEHVARRQVLDRCSGDVEAATRFR